MKTKLIALALLALTTLNSQLATAFAQGTAFTYQGRLNNSGSSASGSYDLVFTLYNTNASGVAIAGPVTNAAVAVTNGLFTTLVDFGPGVFTGTSNWLQIAVSTNGANSFAILTPRQQVTPTPYAIFAGTASNVSGTISAAQLPGSPGFAGTVTATAFAGNGANVTNVNAAALNGLNATNFWQLGGNNVAAGQFLGSTNNQQVIIMVNGLEAERFESPAGGPPNIVGGYVGNFVSGIQAYGVTIGGGGTIGYTNSIQGTNVTFATIAGGVGNTINGANAYHSAIGGGFNNTIAGYTVYESTIAGGYNNVIASQNGFVGGGYVNTIQTNSPYSFIGGGHFNTIQPNTYGSVIGGGYNSLIETNADHSVIGGGWQNQIQPFGYESVISGGELNIIGPGAQWAAIGGGESNTNNSTYSFIGGGYGNAIQANTGNSVIGGGGLNLISSNVPGSFIGGGSQNTIQPNAAYSFVGGGGANTISSNASDSFIGGGWANTVATNANYAVVGGGIYGVASGAGAVVSGGGVYLVTNSNGSFIYSYSGNHAIGTGSTVPGGSGNYAAGDFSLAAGRNAYAPYNGDFVWADYQNSAIAATASNQFVVRASGGVYFQTAGAGFEVDGQPVLSGSYTNTVTLTNAGNSFAGNGAGVTNVNAAALNGLTAANFWQTGGNSGTTPGTQFVGTTDNQALEFKVNGSRALRLEPNATSPNVIGGYSGNYITAGVRGAVISGGGANANTNSIFADYSTIGGGRQNTIQPNALDSTIGGGEQNTIQPNVYDSTIGGGIYNTIQTGADDSTIGGGRQNTILTGAYESAIGGGYQNTIQTNAYDSTIGGGGGNTIQTNAYDSTIGGGGGNNASGDFATVPGGVNNIAGGQFSFAAGQQAQALHPGSFVWADSQNTTFASTANDQFLIRAQGGVGINTNNPGTNALLVNGAAQFTGLIRSGSETGTSEAPSPAGLVVRRINSVSEALGQVVARTDTLTLIRDGTAGGFQIEIPANSGNVTVACMGIDSTGAQKNAYNGVASVITNQFLQIYNNSQSIVHFECTFGVTYNGGRHLTQVTLSRYANGAALDYYWSGNVISTYNQ